MTDRTAPLAGQTAVVVGAGDGIGRATATLLAAAGAHVAVADLDGGRAAEVRDELEAAGGKAVAVSGDVTTPEGATAVVGEAHEGLGGLTGVVNIVGVAGWRALLDMDVAAWDNDMRLNLTHHLLVGQAAARHMIADGTGGAFAMVTSVSGLYGAPMHAAYGAAKAGAMALARSMANEWAPHGIRANCVAPDIIKTPRVIDSFAAQGVDDIDAIAAGEGVPLARWGTPEEIAGPLVFLLSDLSSFMTGQTLVVDGGTRALFPHGGKKAFEPS